MGGCSSVRRNSVLQRQHFLGSGGRRPCLATRRHRIDSVPRVERAGNSRCDHLRSTLGSDIANMESCLGKPCGIDRFRDLGDRGLHGAGGLRAREHRRRESRHLHRRAGLPRRSADDDARSRTRSRRSSSAQHGYATRHPPPVTRRGSAGRGSPHMSSSDRKLVLASLKPTPCRAGGRAAAGPADALHRDAHEPHHAARDPGARPG